MEHVIHTALLKWIESSLSKIITISQNMDVRLATNVLRPLNVTVLVFHIDNCVYIHNHSSFINRSSLSGMNLVKNLRRLRRTTALVAYTMIWLVSYINILHTFGPISLSRVSFAMGARQQYLKKANIMIISRNSMIEKKKIDFVAFVPFYQTCNRITAFWKQ